MQPSNISHVIADISYKDSLDSLYKLKILVGEEYEDEISKQPQAYKDLDLSSTGNVFYVRSIEELRSLMKITPMYDFIIRSYLVYSFHENSTKGLYISSFGGNKISSSPVKNFLVNTVLKTHDNGLLSCIIEMVSGYHNNYDVKTDTFILSDSFLTHCRNRRIEDDVIVDSVFRDGNNTNLSNKDIIAMMRDKNKIPDSMVLKEEYIALEPFQIVTLAYQLIDTKLVETA